MCRSWFYVCLVGLTLYHFPVAFAKPFSELWVEKGTLLEPRAIGAHHISIGLSTELVHSASDQWQLAARYRLGRLESGVDNASIFGAGIQGRYLPHRRLEFSLSVETVYLTSHEFTKDNKKRDMGGPIQFLSQAGIAFALFEDFWLGYQIAHMSNADLYSKNPGLDLHQLVLKYKF